MQRRARRSFTMRSISPRPFERQISSTREVAEPTMTIFIQQHMASILRPVADQVQVLVRSVDEIETKLARLEPVLESQHSEMRVLKNVQQGEVLKIDARLQHSDATAADLHEKVAQVNEQLLILSASYQEDLAQIGKKIDKHSASLRELKVLHEDGVDNIDARLHKKLKPAMDSALGSQQQDILELKTLQQGLVDSIDARLNTVRRRLDQADFGIEALQGQVEENTHGIGDVTGNVKDIEKKMRESFEQALKQHRVEMQEVASRLAETKTMISDNLEPALKKQRQEISGLQALQLTSAGNVKAGDALTKELQACMETQEKHHVEIQAIASWLSENDAAAKGLQASLSETKQDIKDNLEPDLRTQKEQLSRLSTSLLDSLSSLSERLDEVSSAAETLNVRSDKDMDRRCAEMQELSCRVASHQQSLEVQREELSKLKSSHQESLQFQREELSKLNSTHQASLKVQKEEILQVQNDKISKLSVSHQESLSRVSQKLDEVIGTADELRCTADEQQESLKVQKDELFQVQNDQVLKLSASHQESLSSVSRKLDEVVGTAEVLRRRADQQQESLKVHKDEILQVQNAALSKLSASHQESLSSVSAKLGSVIGTAEVLKYRADQQQESLKVQREEILLVQNAALSKLSASHQESLSSVSTKLGEVIGLAEDLRCRADQQKESLKVQKDEILQVQNEELSKLSASHQESLSSVSKKLDKVVGAAEVLKCTTQEHADCLKVLASGISETKNKMSESLEPALEKHQEETRQHTRAASEATAGLSQSGIRLRGMMELAVERHQAELQEATAKVSKTNCAKITELKAMHLHNVELINARLNDGDANAQAMHESLAHLNTTLLKTNSNIVEHLEPGLKAQKDELSMLNTSYKDNLSSVWKRLDKVASATDALQCRVDQHFDALSEMATSIGASNNKMSSSFGPALKQHHMETQDVSAKLEETNAKINDSLEPTLKSRLSEMSVLFDRIDARLKHCDVAAVGLHESVTQVNEKLSNLIASHQEDLNKVGKKLDEHSNGLHEAAADLAETNKKVSKSLEPTLARHHLEIQGVSSRLAETRTQISDGLEPAIKSQRDEISNLKALQQDYFQIVNSRTDQDMERRCAEMQEVSSRVASLQEGLQVQREEWSKLNSSHKESLQIQKEELSKLNSLHQESLKVQREEILLVQNEALSKLSASHQESLSTVSTKLGEVIGTAEVLKHRADQQQESLKVQREEILLFQKEELSKLSASHQESLSNVGWKLDEVIGTAEVLKYRADQQQESLKVQREEMLLIQNAALSKLSASHQESLSSVSMKLGEVIGTAEVLKYRADQQQESLKVQREEILLVQNEELSKLSASHQESLSSVSTKLGEVIGTAEVLKYRADQQQESLKVQREEILLIQNEELSKLSASHQASLGSVSRKVDEVRGTAEELRCRADQQQESLKVQREEILLVQSEELSKLSASHQESLGSVSRKLDEVTGTAEKLRCRADEQQEGLQVQREEILLVHNDELLKLSASHQESLGSVSRKLDEVSGKAQELKSRADEHTDGLKEVVSSLVETKNRMSECLEPAFEKHCEETRQHLRTVHEQLDANGVYARSGLETAHGHIARLNDATANASEVNAELSQSNIKLREVLELALERQRAEMEEVMSRFAATDEKRNAEISGLEATQQSNFASMESQLRDENAAAEALRKAMEEISSGLATVSKGIAENLEPNLMSQNKELAKLQALQESQFATMESRLRDENAAVEALHKVMEDFSSRLAATNRGIAENFEPTLNAQTQEVSKLRAFHFDSFNGMKMRLDEINLVAHTLTARANQQTETLCDVETRLAEIYARIRARLEPSMDAQREEMTGLKASHQDKIAKMEAQLSDTCVSSEELRKQVHHVTAGLAKTDAHIVEKLEGDLRRQNQELSKLSTLNQECVDGVNKKLQDFVLDNGAKTTNLEESSIKLKETLEHALGRHGDESRKNLNSIETRLQQVTEESRGIAKAMASLREHCGEMDSRITNGLVTAAALKQRDMRMDDALANAEATEERVARHADSLCEVASALREERTKDAEIFEKAFQSHLDETKQRLVSIDGRLQSTADNVNQRLDYNERIVQGVREKLNENGNCAREEVQLAQQRESLKSEARVSMERLDGIDRRLEDTISTTASLKERLDGSNSCIVEIDWRLSAATGRLDQIEPVQEKQTEELSCLNAQHQELELRLNTIDERMRHAYSATDEMRETMNALNLRVESVEPEQKKQREDVLQINMALETAMHQVTASQRLGEENHRKFRFMAEARERLDRKDQQTLDSLNSSVANLSLLLQETVHQVNTHASHLKISSTLIRPGTARSSSEQTSPSRVSTRGEGTSSSSHNGNDMTRSPFRDARPWSASSRLYKESTVLKPPVWAVSTSKEARRLPDI